MLEWLRAFNAPRVRVLLSEGKRGFWRWKAVDQRGDTVALCPVKGYRSKHLAERAANQVFRSAIGSIRVERPPHGPH